MGKKAFNSGFFLICLILYGFFIPTALVFSETPTYSDPPGDNGGGPAFEDILQVWVENDEAFIRFKLELNGAFDQMQYPIFYAFISINNETGILHSGWNIRVQYLILLTGTPSSGVAINFIDYVNGSNSLPTPLQGGLANYTLSYNNFTLEIDYKLRSYYLGAGFLNLYLGQMIHLRFQGSSTSDYAPDLDQSLIEYVMKGVENSLLLIFLIIFIPLIGVALGLIILYRRRPLN